MVCGLTARPADLNWPGGQGHHFLHLVPWAASPDVVPPRPLVPTLAKAQVRIRSPCRPQPRCSAPPAATKGLLQVPQGSLPGHPRRKPSALALHLRPSGNPIPRASPPFPRSPSNSHCGGGGGVCVCRDPRQESRPYQDQGIRANMNFKKREIVFPGDEGKETPTLSFRAFT